MAINFTLTVNNGGNKAFDLNSDEELTFGSGTAFKAAFQVCLRLWQPRE
jgi:hypothetical protein